MYIDYTNRIFGLDLIRAVAILFVLVSHSTFLLFPGDINITLTVVQFFGTIGVDLFFVLSGYLIGNIILKQVINGKTKFKDFCYFWIRRWFRTLPNYFLVLFLNIIILYLLKGEIIDNLGRYFVFLQNFATPHPDFFTEAWSLSIEEYAYILGPLLLFIALICFNKTSKTRLFLITVIAIIVLITCFKIHFHFNNSITSPQDWSHQLRKVVVYRIDSIYYGFLSAFLIFKFNDFINEFKNHLFLLGMLIFLGMHAFIMFYDVQPNNSQLFYNLFYLPLVSNSLLLFFPLLINWKNGNKLEYPITSVSILSYGLYLTNYSLVLLTIQHFINLSIQPAFIKFALLLLYWLVSFALSYFIYKYFEKPITSLRDLKIIKSIFNN